MTSWIPQSFLVLFFWQLLKSRDIKVCQLFSKEIESTNAYQICLKEYRIGTSLQNSTLKSYKKKIVSKQELIDIIIYSTTK